MDAICRTSGRRLKDVTQRFDHCRSIGRNDRRIEEITMTQDTDWVTRLNGSYDIQAAIDRADEIRRREVRNFLGLMFARAADGVASGYRTVFLRKLDRQNR
jgi:hypothetical protein